MAPEGLRLGIRKILLHHSNLRRKKETCLHPSPPLLFPRNCTEDCLAVSDTSLPTSCCYCKSKQCWEMP